MTKQAQTIIRGLVVHGNHLGRTLGFPTANLQLDENNPFLLPFGVYAVRVETDRLTFRGMANAGVRPTIDGTTLTVEIHLFDFDGDLYGKVLTVQFFERIRAEIKFDSLDDLVNQIREDKQHALRLLA